MRNILLIIGLIFFSLRTNAQDSIYKKKFDPENLFIGGSISLGLGGYNNEFVAGIHPHFGYTLAKWIDVATLINFEYNSSKDIYNNKYHNTTYGLGVLSRIYPVNFLFLQVEPEYNFIALKFIPDVGSVQKLKVNAPSLLIGAGYVTSRSDKNSFTYLSILIDVLKDPNSPYIDGNGNSILVIRAGINIGLTTRRTR